MRSVVVLPPSRHRSALTSEPRPAECCCGQRRPRRPGCCRETRRSLHTRGALKTCSTARREKGETRAEWIICDAATRLRSYRGNYTRLGLVTASLTFICVEYTQLEINNFKHSHQWAANGPYSDRYDYTLLLLIRIFLSFYSTHGSVSPSC